MFIYLESANDEQNGGQSFVLRPRIAKLWQFKGRKVENNGEEDCIALFMADLSRVYGGFMAIGFFRIRQRMVPFSTGTNGE